MAYAIIRCKKISEPIIYEGRMSLMKLQTRSTFPRRMTAIVLALLLTMPFMSPLAAFAEETVPVETVSVPAGDISAARIRR